MKTLALMSLFVLTSLNALAAPKTVTLEVPTMNCVTCPFTVEKALQKVDGVSKAEVTFKTKLAVVTIGYADGLPRDLPQRGGQVLIQGRRCPMVGWMCMDQLLVDVSDLSEVAPGDTVTIIGRDGGQVIRAEELAACCGTITNELLSRLGMRLPIVSG